MSDDEPAASRPDDRSRVAPGPAPFDRERLERSGLATARDAIREVRREVRKAALLYAVVDGALTAALVNLVLAAVAIGGLPEPVTLPVPGPVAGVLEVFLGGDVRGLAVTGAGVVAVAAGSVVAGIEYWRLARRGTVEWFERANPGTAEALRTARDVVEDDDDDLMARVLYGDVLDRLRAASGVRLVDPRRLGIAIVVVVVASLLAAQVSLVGFVIDLDDIAPNVTLDGGAESGGAPPPGGGADGGGDGGLADPDSILGDPEDVDRGSVEIPVEIATGSGGGDPADRPYEASGFPSEASAVEAQEAGFAPPEDLEDADLVREYNLRIREVTGGDAADDRTRLEGVRDDRP